MVPSDNFPPNDEAWTDLLRPLREPELPEPRPYFYTRLEARMAAEQRQPLNLPWWLRRPAHAATLGALVLSLNVGAAVHYVQQQKPLPPAPDGYAAFAADYQLDPFQYPHD